MQLNNRSPLRHFFIALLIASVVGLVVEVVFLISDGPNRSNVIATVVVGVVIVYCAITLGTTRRR